MTKRLLLAIVLVLGLVACGGDDDDDDVGSASGGTGLSEEEAAARLEDAVLTEEDLGEGWAVDDSEDDDEDDISDEQMAECIGDEDVAAIFEDDSDVDLGEPVERSYQREDPAQLAFQVVEVSSGAVQDAALYRTVVEVFADGDFGDCMLDVVSDSLAEEGQEFTISFGDWESDTGFADGADHSVLGGATFEMSGSGITLDGRLDMFIVSTGQLGSFVMAMGIGEPITADQLDTWAGLLLDRLAT